MIQDIFYKIQGFQSKEKIEKFKTFEVFNVCWHRAQLQYIQEDKSHF